MAIQELPLRRPLLTAAALSRARGLGGLWLVACAWVVTRAALFFRLPIDADVESAFYAADAVVRGVVPYAEHAVALPPGALALAIAPRLVTDSLSSYATLSACLALVADLVALVAAFCLPRATLARRPGDAGGPPGPGGSGPSAAGAATLRRALPTLTGLGYIALTAAIGDRILHAPVLFAAALIAAAVLAAARGRWLLCDVALIAATSIDVRAALLLPLLVMHRRAAAVHDQQPPTVMLRATGHLLLRAVLIVGLALLPSFALGGAAGAWAALAGTRFDVLNAASAGGALLLFVAGLGSGAVAEGETGGMAVRAIAALGGASAVAAGCFVAARAMGSSTILTRTLPAARLRFLRASTRATELVRGAAACLLFAAILTMDDLARGLVLCAPLLAALLARSRGPRALWLLLIAIALQGRMFSLADETLSPLALLLFCALLTFAAAVTLAMTATTATSPTTPTTASASLASFAVPSWAAPSLLIVWAALANTNAVEANDVHIQMRVGADILARGAVPTVEEYSATAAGREFVAHEWLASVLFHVVGAPLDGALLSLMATAIAVLIVLVLVRVAHDVGPAHVLTVPIVTLAVFVLSARVMVRPHLFAMLFVALLMLALERWRRSGRWRDLLWLPPLHVLWVNLHGSAFLGPALLSLMAGVVLLQLALPSLRERAPDGERRPRGRDVVQLACTAGAAALCCLVNPRGARLFDFSRSLFGDSHYIRERIFEWGHPFQYADGRQHWLLAFVLLLALLWLGLGLRARLRPTRDVASALVATGLSLWAVRFLSEMAILALPVVLRSIEVAVRPLIARRFFAPRPALEVLIGVLLVAAVVHNGLALAPADHRRVALGFGGDMPDEEVTHIARQGLAGVIFNEYEDGALIIRHLAPRVRPVMDSRIDVYGAELVGEYGAARASEAAFYDYLDRHRVTLVLLRQKRDNGSLLDSLDASADWRRELVTPRRALYVRSSPLPELPTVR